jgi:DNA polymerase-3 subunit epsilon
MRWLRRRPAAGLDRRWVVVDVESSGLDVRRDHLLAIAGVALQLAPGRRPRIDLTDSFEALLRPPEGTDPAGASNILIHGLGLGQQRSGVDPGQALAAFDAWAGAAPRLGFHVDFDRAMIERAHPARTGPPARWLDLEPLAAIALRRSGPLALDDALRHHGIVCAERHEAAADALATAELLLAIWPALEREGATDFRRAAGLAAARRWLSPR